jgi:putative membrane protein insertion efficiency factor
MTAFFSRCIRRSLCGLIRVYQGAVSPFFRPSCRFVPSCSNYALEALQRKPLLEGLWLIVRRLCRCHPFCKGGFDPVPPDRERSPNATRPVVPH